MCPSPQFLAFPVFPHALPSPIQQHRSLTISPPKLKPPHEAIESLTLEIKVQDLLDRVTVLEEGQAHMLEMQRSILQK
jgi:hypothetical protein